MGLAKLREKLTVLRRLENELRRIRQRIDAEENAVRKAKIINAYGKISMALIGKEM